MLGADGIGFNRSFKSQILIFVLQNCKNSAVSHSIEKSASLYLNSLMPNSL